jgi:LmbE family N-acetylglucosaminyl deacetylase/glycosyltransferase involved in cell wall biosynthesis
MDEDQIVPYKAAEIHAERVLVLAAHPDDEVFGAGGLLARLASSGSMIRVVVFTGGEAQETKEPGSSDPETRRREAREAGAVLSVNDFTFVGLPDRSLDSRRPEIEERLEAEIQGFEPDLILAPSPCEVHPDHRALADAVYQTVASSRTWDPGNPAIRHLQLAFYEVSLPLLPNALVPLGEFGAAKKEAIARFSSQAAVRDYAGAIAGLNAFRSLTLQGAGSAEGFRTISALEAAATSLEEFRRRIGPGTLSPGERQVGNAAVVVRTKNRPGLLAEALDSLAAQNVRPKSVVVVNDGGASPAAEAARFRDAFALTVIEHENGRGRAAAANAGAEKTSEETLAFLDDDDVFTADHLERLLAARRAGPEPIVYSDAVTVLLESDGEGWRERHRELQYSMDFDPDYLLLANYIPLHTVLFDRALFARVGGFDPGFEYSEDWDLLIRLSFEAPFRHIRAVTAHYRVFEGEAGHVQAGGEAFQKARRKILSRYKERRSDEGMLRVLDRLSQRLWRLDQQERTAASELVYQRDTHRRLDRKLEAADQKLAKADVEWHRMNGTIHELQKRISELAASNDDYGRKVAELYGEIHRLNELIHAMEGTKAWRLHLFVNSLRGKG